MLTDEYDYHPRWGEGPWLLSPKGPGTGSAAAPAPVRAERCAIGSRLVTEFGLGGLRVTQETILWDGAGPGRVPHPRGRLDRPGRAAAGAFPGRRAGRAAGVPVRHQRGGQAVRRAGRRRGAARRSPSTTRRTSGSASAPQRAWSPDGRAWPIGVAEVIVPAVPNGCRAAVRDLVTALAGQGVTATCSRPDGPRYGALDLDSNVPDCRIALGGPDVNPWTARLLAALGPAGELARRLAGRTTRRPAARRTGGARVWVPAGRPRAEVFGPGADVRGDRDLPVLIVAGPDLAAAVAALASDLAARDDRGGTGPRRRVPGPAAGRPLRGAAQPRHAQQPGQRRRDAAHRADAGQQRLAGRGLDRRGAAHRAGREQLRLAALEPHVRVRAGGRGGRLARRGIHRRRARNTTTTCSPARRASTPGRCRPPPACARSRPSASSPEPHLLLRR